MVDMIKKLGDTDKLTVQKSKPLFALWQSDLTLSEFKILDTYLGRINSHDDKHRTVMFEKGELEKLLGVKQLKPQVLDDRLKNLMTSVCIPDENKNGFIRISLFEKAHAEQDEYGIWRVELTCTESAKKYIFNLEEIQYLRYKLRNIINIKSRYTYIMFLYLWENKYRGTWEEPLDKLKSILNCERETYKQFKRFNDLILKKIRNEIHEVTDIKYDYETVKKGRSVIAIKFIYHAQTKSLDMPTIEAKAVRPDRELWENVLDEFNFSQEQLNQIRSFLDIMPEHLLPQSPACYDSIDLRRYHYMQLKIADLKRIHEEKPIRNFFAYLLAVLKKDVQK